MQSHICYICYEKHSKHVLMEYVLMSFLSKSVQCFFGNVLRAFLKKRRIMVRHCPSLSVYPSKQSRFQCAIYRARTVLDFIISLNEVLRYLDFRTCTVIFEKVWVNLEKNIEIKNYSWLQAKSFFLVYIFLQSSWILYFVNFSQKVLFVFSCVKGWKIKNWKMVFKFL